MPCNQGFSLQQSNQSGSKPGNRKGREKGQHGRLVSGTEVDLYHGPRGATEESLGRVPMEQAKAAAASGRTLAVGFPHGLARSDLVVGSPEGPGRES